MDDAYHKEQRNVAQSAMSACSPGWCTTTSVVEKKRHQKYNPSISTMHNINNDKFEFHDGADVVSGLWLLMLPIAVVRG